MVKACQADGKERIEDNMNKDDLLKIIRKIVKEEVSTQCKQIIYEEMNKQMARLLAEVLKGGSPTRIVEQPKPVVGADETIGDPRLITESAKRVTPPTRIPRKFTGIPEIDAAMNATVPDLPKDDSLLDSVVNGAGSTGKIGDTESLNLTTFLNPSPEEVEVDMSSKMNMIKSLVGTSTDHQPKPSALDIPDSINPLAGVFKSDFRSKMKSINKIADGMRGSLMPPPSIDPNEWRQLDSEQ